MEKIDDYMKKQIFEAENDYVFSTMFPLFKTALITPKTPDTTSPILHFQMCVYVGLPSLMKGFKVYQHNSLEFLPSFLQDYVTAYPIKIYNENCLILEFVTMGKSYYVICSYCRAFWADKDLVNPMDELELAFSLNHVELFSLYPDFLSY